MHIELDRGNREPLYRQLATSVQQRIRSGALPPRTRLPTVRQLAQQLGVTRLTVHSAYAKLQAEGWIEATVGRGTFVAESIEQLITPPEAQLGREVTPAGMLADLLRMAQLPGLLMLARADPDPTLFPLRAWQRAVEVALSQGGPALMNYTTAQGDLQLRSVLAKLVRERGISAGPDEIMVLNGVNHGIALASDLLAGSGATVVVEQPTYLGMLNVLHARNIRALGVELDAEGPILADLEQIVRTERPAFFYTIPTNQNPSGICMSSARRAALLELAERYRLPIVEDDIYSAISFDGPPPAALKATDRSGLVLYLSSFAKNLMPGLRLGYAVAAPGLLQRMVTLRQAGDICSPLLTQRALTVFLEQGALHSHLRRVLPRYQERRDALLRAMSRFFPPDVSWTQPQGGYSCWVRLPAGVNVTDLYLSAIGRGVGFTPGAVFSAAMETHPHLRLCYGTEGPDRLGEAVATLGSLLRERRPGQANPRPAMSDFIPVV
jgi:DNA-binding transcriptional MocR family regulator